MLYQIYDLCLYPIKLKDKRGEHGAASGCQVPACPVINMFCGCGNSRNVQGTSGDILFSSKAGAQLSPALMSPLLAHGDCRACRRAEELGCLGAPGPCKIAPDRGYFHGRHCSMWTLPPPPIPPCVHMLHAEDPTHSLVLWVLLWGYVPCPHFNASSHPNLVEPLDFSFLAATPHVLKCPSCRTLYFSFWISQSQPKLGTLASGASLHPWPLGETLSCPGPALLYLLPHRTLQ